MKQLTRYRFGPHRRYIEWRR